MNVAIITMFLTLILKASFYSTHPVLDDPHESAHLQLTEAVLKQPTKTSTPPHDKRPVAAQKKGGTPIAASDSVVAHTATSSGMTTVPDTVARVRERTIGVPLRLRIPKIGVDSRIEQAGLTPAGDMETPQTLSEVGWYTGGARPGEIGAAVIAGHFSQIRGGVVTKAGVFFNLDSLEVGDQIYVVDDVGALVEFVVRERRMFDPAGDTRAIFTSTDGRAHLNLVTCDGVWNPELGAYSQRLIVFADAVL